MRRPDQTRACRIGRARYATLVETIRETLELAIGAGGSTLRDYVGSDGQAGYFQNNFLVCDRAQLPCFNCRAPVRACVQGQRSTYYCPRCQR